MPYYSVLPSFQFLRWMKQMHRILYGMKNLQISVPNNLIFLWHHFHDVMNIYMQYAEMYDIQKHI